MTRKNEKAMLIDTTVGKNIDRLRLAKGWSNSILADKIDVTHQQVAKYIKGTNRVSAGRLQLIADAFYIPVAELFPAKEDEAPMRNRLTLELIRGFNNLNPLSQEAIVKLVRAL